MIVGVVIVSIAASLLKEENVLRSVALDVKQR